MRYLKKLSKLICLIGFIIIIGTIGNSDFQESIRHYYPFGECLKRIFIGMLLMLPQAYIVLLGGKNG